jgi:hypothetical protein
LVETLNLRRLVLVRDLELKRRLLLLRIPIFCIMSVTGVSTYYGLACLIHLTIGVEIWSSNQP